MDGLPPSERPVATLHPIAGGGALRLRIDQPPQTVGAQWLTEFLRREGIPEDRILPSPEMLQDEPAQKSYKGRAFIGIGVLLAAGAIGAFVYQRDVLDAYQRWVAPVVVALKAEASGQPAAPAAPHPSALATNRAPPAPAVPALASAAPVAHVVSPPSLSPLPPVAHPPTARPPLASGLGLSAPAFVPIPPHQEMLSPLGDPATAFGNFPQQPVDPPPTVMSNWAGALVIPTPLAGAPTGPAAAMAASPQSGPIALPASPVAGLAALTLPAGTPLYLRIVYTPADPARPHRFDALTRRLRSQVAGIASVTASVGPAAYSSVDYFFPGDRAGASRLAAILARMTRRAEPLVLLHANPLPRPGTIEIRLTSRVGKELINEGY